MSRAGRRSLDPQRGEIALRRLRPDQRALLAALGRETLLSLFDTSRKRKLPPPMDEATVEALKAFEDATPVKGEKEK